ncbi:MAG TPA: hypothetical protein VGL18_11575 [Actinomycetota bacterium]
MPIIEHMFDAKRVGERVRAALLAYPDPSGLTEDQAEAGFAQLQRISELVEAKRLRWLAELERRASYRQDGYLSAAAWLSDRFGLAAGQAGEGPDPNIAGASWTTRGRSILPRPIAWPATPRSCRWSWAAHPSPWMSGGEPRWCRQPCPGRSPSEIVGADFLGATGLTRGVKRTTSSIGPTEG